MPTSARRSFCPRNLVPLNNPGAIVIIMAVTSILTSSACRRISSLMPRSIASTYYPAVTMNVSTRTYILKASRRPATPPTSSLLQARITWRKMDKSALLVRMQPSKRLCRRRRMSTITSWTTREPSSPQRWTPDGRLLLIWASSLKTPELTRTTCSSPLWSLLIKYQFRRVLSRGLPSQEFNSRMRLARLSDQMLLKCTL